MSIKQAQQDGIRYEKNIGYFPNCNRCGRETFSKSYLSGRKYTCSICKMRRADEIERNKKRARMR